MYQFNLIKYFRVSSKLQNPKFNILKSCWITPLFSSEKYEHHTPWPAFKNPIYPDSLAKELETEPQETSDGVALKVTCGKCGNPLGHEFLKDGPRGVGSRF